MANDTASISAEQPEPDNPSDKLNYKGVTKRKSGKWDAQIGYPKTRRNLWLGSFRTPEKAARAFDAALYCLSGCTANFNFPHSAFDFHPNVTSACLTPSEIRTFAARFANENFTPPAAAAGGKDFNDSNRMTEPMQSDPAARMPAPDNIEGAAQFDEFNRATEAVLIDRGGMTRLEKGLGSNPTVRTPAATPVSNTKAVSSSRFGTIFLPEWWLVKTRGNGLAVGGVASLGSVGERLFFSTVIAKRHATNIVETEDGITIIFGGLINRPFTHQNGFPLEVCDCFMLGFPHNWEEYTANGLRDEQVNGEDGVLTISEDYIDATTLCLLVPKKIHNVVQSLGNVCKESDLNKEMECNITMKTEECITEKDTMDCTTSQPQADLMLNGKNGVAVVTAEKQDEISKIGCQTVTDKNAPNPGRGLSRSADKFPVTSKKARNDRLLSDRKEHRCIKQKMILEDGGNSCERIETRSMSKRIHGTMLVGKGEEKTADCVSSSVRRSARLRNLKN